MQEPARQLTQIISPTILDGNIYKVTKSAFKITME